MKIGLIALSIAICAGTLSQGVAFGATPGKHVTNRTLKRHIRSAVVNKLAKQMRISQEQVRVKLGPLKIVVNGKGNHQDWKATRTSKVKRGIFTFLGSLDAQGSVQTQRKVSRDEKRASATSVILKEQAFTSGKQLSTEAERLSYY
ncbi:MAG: hypothetical protein JRH20_19265 [Deltaproteobacteria bacterium]|nr:hypothetical protein [Deltaproteobacteria bacterium]